MRPKIRKITKEIIKRKIALHGFLALMCKKEEGVHFVFIKVFEEPKKGNYSIYDTGSHLSGSQYH